MIQREPQGKAENIYATQGMELTAGNWLCCSWFLQAQLFPPWVIRQAKDIIFQNSVEEGRQIKILFSFLTSVHKCQPLMPMPKITQNVLSLTYVKLEWPHGYNN